MSPPSHIFVVRHGNRLDAVDKHWHMTSPTPYDPPLTYSGWVQSRTVGAQISEILRDQAAASDASQPDQQPRKRKRYRVVIHSSPFLRCIQTSVAISAGLLGRPSLLAAAHRNLSPNQMSQAASPPDTPGSPSKAKPRRTSVAGRKIVMRIDAFLGEWLSPGYFELITPPPGSVMMLASAKASLLKAENYNQYPHIQTRAHSNSSAQPPTTTHLWGAASRSSPLAGTPVSAVEDNSPAPALDNLSAIAKALPKDARSVSASGWGDASQNLQVLSTTGGVSPKGETGAYDPPVPAFSMPKNATIPAGYVNHAKDRCVVVDYQWDSTRPPYDWGDGGELPEDWPDMHRRFRKGLQALVDWYTTADDPASAVTTEFVKPNRNGQNSPVEEDEVDDEAETVVIVVSHGAGCNAMIGAITHKPVLMDIPISSLTMASLKKPLNVATPQLANGAGPPPIVTTINTPLHQSYDLTMFASTDHLRPTPPTSTPSRSPSMAHVLGAGGVGIARGRSSNSFSSPSGDGGASTLSHIDGLNRSSSVSGSLASIRRGLHNPPAGPRGLGISSSSGNGGSAVYSPSGLSKGLWSPAPPPILDEESVVVDDDVVLLDPKPAGTETTTASALGSTNAAPSAAEEGAVESPRGRALDSTPSADDAETEEQKDKLTQLRSAPRSGNGGLWDPLSTMGDGEVVRDLSSSKRRWTVNERP